MHYFGLYIYIYIYIYIWGERINQLVVQVASLHATDRYNANVSEHLNPSLLISITKLNRIFRYL